MSIKESFLGNIDVYICSLSLKMIAFFIFDGSDCSAVFENILSIFSYLLGLALISI